MTTTDSTTTPERAPGTVPAMVQPLSDPCYDGETHRWRTLYEPPCNLPVRWCRKCGKRVQPNNKSPHQEPAR